MAFYAVVRWVLMAQVLAGVVAGLLLWVTLGLGHGVSAWLGSLVAWVPNLYFSYRFGRRDDRRTARQVIGALYSGEAIKWLLTFGLFAAVLWIPGIRVLSLFAGYIVTLTVFWFALLVRTAGDKGR